MIMVSLSVSTKKEGGLHLGEGELEIVVEVVQVEEEVTDTAAQGQQQVAVARICGELDEVFAHTFIELLILQTQYLHGSLAHLAQLSLWICFIGHKVSLQIYLLFHLLPHVVPILIHYEFRHIEQQEPIHLESLLESPLVEVNQAILA